MDIPKLQKSSRSREFFLYNDLQHALIVKQYLIDMKSHRQLDEDVLHLDGSESRGWQSMGVLHYLGLTKPFKGIFEGMNVQSAIQELRNSNNDDYSQIIKILEFLL